MEPIEIRDSFKPKFEDGWPNYLSIGDGWLPLVQRLDKDLRAIEPDIKYYQIKQKFGGLRVYVSTVTGTNALMLIAEAEREAERTCEICGAPGKTITRDYYIQTVCSKH